MTLVAAAGEDASYGLPSVRPGPFRSSRKQTTVALGNAVIATLDHDIHDPWAYLPAIAWSTRGWTFQEARLSTRLVYFTDAEVYYECA